MSANQIGFIYFSKRQKRYSNCSLSYKTITLQAECYRSQQLLIQNGIQRKITFWCLFRFTTNSEKFYHNVRDIRVICLGKYCDTISKLSVTKMYLSLNIYRLNQADVITNYNQAQQKLYTETLNTMLKICRYNRSSD